MSGVTGVTGAEITGVTYIEVSLRRDVIMERIKKQISFFLNMKNVPFVEKIRYVNAFHISIVVKDATLTGFCKYCKNPVQCMKHHLLNTDCYVHWLSQLYDFTKKIMQEYPHLCRGVSKTPLEVVLDIMPARNNRDIAVIVALSTLDK